MRANHTKEAASVFVEFVEKYPRADNRGEAAVLLGDLLTRLKQHEKAAGYHAIGLLSNDEPTRNEAKRGLVSERTRARAVEQRACVCRNGCLRGGCMKVVLDARYIRPRASGIKTYSQALIDRMPAIVPETEFSLWRHPDVPNVINAANNVAHHEVRTPANGLRTLLRPNTLDAIDEGDVFHAMFNILGYRLKCPTVTTVHDIRWLEATEDVRAAKAASFVQACISAGIRNALRMSDIVLTVSQASADRIVREEPSATPRIRITPCGCAPQFVPPRSKCDAWSSAAAILGNDQPYFLCVGVHLLGKGQDVALRAFVEVAKPGERLVIVHRSDGASRRQALVDHLRLQDRVTLLHSLEVDELVTLIQGAQALLQPSRYEGFGIPVLEAMSCRCAVICSDIEALKEVAGEAAQVVPVGNVQRLAAEMRRVGDDPYLRAELQSKGLERAQGFSWERASRLTLEAYGEAAGIYEKH